MFDILTLLQNILFFMLYIGNTNEFPKPLSQKDEEKYLNLYKLKNDQKARNILIERNLRLVAHIIKKYYAHTADVDDLISIGTIGLIKGIDAFDDTKGTRLATYCARCIENEILMYFRFIKKNSIEISMQEEIDSDSEGNPLTLMDIVSSDDTIVDDLELKIKIKKLYEYINTCLTQREREIICLRYGIYNTRPLPQREIASRFNISRSYVSRIEKKALQKLAKQFQK